MTRSLKGVFAAALTPRRPGKDQIDLAGAYALIDYLCSAGVDGLVLLGSTGEFVHFSLEERLRFAALAIRRSRVPVIVNCTHSTTDGTLELARSAAAAGAAAVLVMPPYFFRYDLPELETFFCAVSAEVRDRAPCLLYNIPVFTNRLPLELAIQLVREGLFAGIKDSGGDLFYFTRFRAACPEAIFFAGQDVLYHQLKPQGACGVVSGLANATPELLLALDRALSSGDQAKADRLALRVRELAEQVDQFPIPAAIREAALIRQVTAGPHAVHLDEAKRQRFAHWFRAWLPEMLRDCAGA